MFCTNISSEKCWQKCPCNLFQVVIIAIMMTTTASNEVETSLTTLHQLCSSNSKTFTHHQNLLASFTSSSFRDTSGGVNSFFKKHLSYKAR
jgi:hypothetical protein